MKSTRAKLFLTTTVLAATLSPLMAQVAQPAPELVPAPQNTWDLEWEGVVGRTYFIQCSPDLENWFFMPYIESGSGQPIEYGLSSSGQKMFVRLAYSDIPTSDPENADFDGDGLTNLEEVGSSTIEGIGTNPLDPDTDGDGFEDGDEIVLGNDATDSSDTPPEVALEIRRSQIGYVFRDYSANENVDSYAAAFGLYITGSSNNFVYGLGLTQGINPSLHSPSSSLSFLETLHGQIAEEDHWQIVGDDFPNTYSRWFSEVDGDYQGNEIHQFFAEFRLRNLRIGSSGETTRNANFLRLVYDNPFYDPNAVPAEVEAIALPVSTNSTTISELRSSQISENSNEVVWPVNIIVPKIAPDGSQVPDEFVTATQLKIAKWENAFEGDNTNGSVRNDFIDYDKDRFYVSIREGFSRGITSMEIATEDNPNQNYNDDPTEIDLMDIGDGTTAISEAMILVADDHDDDYAGSGAGADDQKNDRTHKIQLGGNLVIKSLTIRGQKHETNFSFPVRAEKKLSLDVYRFNVPDVSSLAQINESMDILKEYYAQVGLKIEPHIHEMAPWPNIETAGDGLIDIFDEPEGKLIGPLSSEYKNFVDEVDVAGIKVNLFFINSAYPSLGIAIGAKQVPYEGGSVDVKYLENAFINCGNLGSAGPVDTPAHEILHLLSPEPERDDHSQHFSNLLRDVNPNQDPVLWSKRINEQQEKRIFEH
jgi:hypothetical protein